MKQTTETPTKTELIAALRAWVAQRPRLEFANYGNVPAYRAESRSITQDLKDATVLISAVESAPITVQGILDAFRAYSGRLSWTPEGLEYCTGQYWPTEYRRAVCAVCADALWTYERSKMDNVRGVLGDVIRAHFKRAFGNRIAKRWFD